MMPTLDIPEWSGIGKGKTPRNLQFDEGVASVEVADPLSILVF